MAVTSSIASMREKETTRPSPPPSSGADSEGESKPADSPPPPPNGGLQAWLQVAGAFFLFFNSWGVVNTFGVFQSYYKSTLIPDVSPSSISWIGTTQGFLLFLAGVVAGPFFDKGHMRLLVFLGTAFITFGLMMTSICTEYYQLFLAQGVVVGLGCGFVFLPSIAIVATYFTSRRAIATGITASGGSIGSVIYPIIFRRLIEPVGFGWTTRVIGFVALVGLGLPLVVLKSRFPPPKAARALFDFSAFKELPFVVFGFGIFCSLTGLYFPFFYLPTYFTSYLHTDSQLATYSVAILNAGSFVGRIAPGFLADKFGSTNTIIPTAFISALLAYAWISIHNLPGVIAYACLYGAVSGAMVSLPATVVATALSPNMGVVGTRLGMTFLFGGLGLFIGNPIAGALLDVEKVVFWKAQLFSAVMLTMAMVCFTGMRLLKWKSGAGWKV